jgi:hypothetical protein
MSKPVEIRGNEEGTWVIDRRSDDPIKKFFHLHNPFYLVSAACMLLGCYLVAGAVTGDSSASRLIRVLVMLGALNVYELLLVGLSCFLIVKKKQVRDGLVLLLIEVLLLADSTNLLHETYALSFRVGVQVNLAALILALAKASAVVWALKLRFSVRELAAAASGYLAMLLVPGVLTAINRGGGSMALPLHWAWWIAGLLPLGIALLLPRLSVKRTKQESRLGTFALGAPWASLGLHLLMASWQYGEVFHFANLAPVLIGWTGVALWRGRAIMPRPRLHIFLTACGFLSLLVTAFATTELQGTLPVWGRPVYSPLRATMLALGSLYVWAALLGMGWGYASAGIINLIGLTSGHSVPAILNNWTTLLGRIVPSSKTGWGVLAVIAAFLSLGAGALLSVLRKPPVEEPRTQTGG